MEHNALIININKKAPMRIDRCPMSRNTVQLEQYMKNMKYKHYNTLIIRHAKANNRKQDITPHDYCTTRIMD